MPMFSIKKDSILIARKGKKSCTIMKAAFKAGTRQNFVVSKSDDIPSEGGSLKNQPGK